MRAHVVYFVFFLYIHIFRFGFFFFGSSLFAGSLWRFSKPHRFLFFTYTHICTYIYILCIYILCVYIACSQHLSIFTVLFVFCLHSLAEKSLLKKEAQRLRRARVTNLPTYKTFFFFLFNAAKHLFLS